MATKKRTRANSHTTKTTRSKRASSSAEKKASPKKRAATRSKTKSTTGKTIRKKSTGSKSTKARSSTRKETVSKASSEQRTGTQKKGKSPSDKVVTIDRRCPLSPKDFGLDKALSQSEKPGLERRKKVQRRRQIDPTTCERDYSMNEIEFMSAMD